MMPNCLRQGGCFPSGLSLSMCLSAKYLKQESRAVAREPRDVAAVVFGFSSPTTFTTSLRVAKLRKPGFRAPNVPAQNRI